MSFTLLSRTGEEKKQVRARRKNTSARVGKMHYATDGTLTQECYFAQPYRLGKKAGIYTVRASGKYLNADRKSGGSR